MVTRRGAATAATPYRPLALVVAAVVSVQFGGALAATLVPEIGAGGSVLLRLLFATAVLGAIARPRLRRLTRRATLTVLGFGLSLGFMNLAFYASLGRLPIGVAVTIEFLGPLTLATVLSRRWRDVGAVLAAALGVVLISEVLQTSWRDLEWAGLGLAALAGAFWAAYIIASRHTGREFEQLEGLALAMAVALLVVLPFGVGSIGSWSGETVLKGLGIAVLSSVLPYSFELAALRRLSPRVFGVLLSLEPAAAAVAGLLLLGQRLGPVQVAGMALVIAASALVLGSARDDVAAGPEATGP